MHLTRVKSVGLQTGPRPQQTVVADVFNTDVPDKFHTAKSVVWVDSESARAGNDCRFTRMQFKFCLDVVVKTDNEQHMADSYRIRPNKKTIHP